MIKKTIINDEVMYVKTKESGLKWEALFNRKGCDNSKRGHVVFIDGKEEYIRQAPALDVGLSRGSIFVSASGAMICPIETTATPLLIS